jgi:Cu-Zn family superoxide dismutase
MRTRLASGLLVTALGSLVVGAHVACTPTTGAGNRPIVETEGASPGLAVAQLSPASGSAVSGTVTFEQRADGVHVHVIARALAPGEHGFHVHEKGDCSAPDATSAGDHFNPGHSGHGARDASVRHAGDLGNLRADSLGNVDATFVDKLITLSGSDSIVGRAVIVHAQRDDLTSQPGGNAGGRVACGVIEAQR